MRNSLLVDILSQPTAPYREYHVLATVIRALLKNRVPYFFDPVGNLVVGAKDKKGYLQKVRKKSKEPLRIYVAHTDHPGFHGVKWLGPKKFRIKWFGGSPTRLLNGAKVWIADPAGYAAEGKISNAKLMKPAYAIDTADVTLKPGGRLNRQMDAKNLFGGFGFRKPVWKKGEMIYTKAADDLVGTATIVSLAIDLWKAKSPARNHFIGVLTRAEEVGFVGCIGHLELGWLGDHKTRTRYRQQLFISLETSRTMPGAVFGKGPVVRLGDRFSVFDAGSLKVLTDLARKTLKGKHQRKLMDGGTCEATVSVINGIPAVGISIPLGNYHNESYEGGPDSRGHRGPGPEFVHLKDIDGMGKLCKSILKSGLPWNKPWNESKKALRKRYIRGKKFL